jgi:hypothetical protein
LLVQQLRNLTQVQDLNAASVTQSDDVRVAKLDRVAVVDDNLICSGSVPKIDNIPSFDGRYIRRIARRSRLDDLLALEISLTLAKGRINIFDVNLSHRSILSLVIYGNE